jgi:methionyl-tRNA formyltransferase
VRVVFWGSPAFAVPILEVLLASPHEVVGVVSQPARPKGRGQGVAATPVAERAAVAGLPVLTPGKPRGDDFLERLVAFDGEVFLVAAYGEILPRAVLETPPRGALNVHASLLPAYRGAAPVTRAILDGRRVTGVTIMRMEAGLDTGPICLQSEEPIRPDDTAGSLAERLAGRGAGLAVEALDLLEAGRLIETPQDDRLATSAPKVEPAEARLEWSRTTSLLERAVRAFDPWPGAWTTWREERLKVFRLESRPHDAHGPPGEILATAPALVVRTGDGAVGLVLVQPPGGRRMSGADWVRGREVRPGQRLGE